MSPSAAAGPIGPTSRQRQQPPLTDSKPSALKSKQKIDSFTDGKENNEPRRNVGLDDMEIDSSSNDSSGDWLALSFSSSDSEYSASPQTLSTAQTDQRNEREIPSFADSSAKRLQYNHSSNVDDNDSSPGTGTSSSDDLDGEDIEDDGTECSGGTAVHNDFPSPPNNATYEEMNQYYWEVCYGERAQEMMDSLEKQKREGLRSAPAKSW